MQVHPPPEKMFRSETSNTAIEEGKFRPDMSARKNSPVLLRYDKIKTKKVGKKKESLKGKG